MDMQIRQIEIGYSSASLSLVFSSSSLDCWKDHLKTSFILYQGGVRAERARWTILKQNGGQRFKYQIIPSQYSSTHLGGHRIRTRYEFESNKE